MVNVTQFVRQNFQKFYCQSSHPTYFSHLFKTIEAIPKGKDENMSSCKSFKLMLQHGYIFSSSQGIYNLMPLAVISLDKLSRLVEYLMRKIDGQKVLLPTLAHSSLWKTSGRWNYDNSHLFKLKDRNLADYCLGPTHEEEVTKLVAEYHPSFKHLPLTLFQISTKYRDELRPKLGLLRGREFLMKDMYTFDSSEENAKVTYSDVCGIYSLFFRLLGVDWVKVEASNAGMGGNQSHEYHFLSDVGEDEIFYCPQCRTGVNIEISSVNPMKCLTCDTLLQKQNAIEVGHTFLLGTTYSEPFKAKFKAQDGTLRTIHMGCYGLGLSRILAASIECLSTNDRIRWPPLIAPFLVSVIPPKKGSKEEDASVFTDFIHTSLRSIDLLSQDIIIDDRTNLTIGKRLQEANYMGVRYAIILGPTVLQTIPTFELTDCYQKKTWFMNHMELMTFFKDLNNTYKCDFYNHL